MVIVIGIEPKTNYIVSKLLFSDTIMIQLSLFVTFYLNIIILFLSSHFAEFYWTFPLRWKRHSVCLHMDFSFHMNLNNNFHVNSSSDTRSSTRMLKSKLESHRNQHQTVHIIFESIFKKIFSCRFYLFLFHFASISIFR